MLHRVFGSPLLYWLLIFKRIVSVLMRHPCLGLFPPPEVDVPESQQYHPEELNRKALAIIERVRQKLTGTCCTCLNTLLTIHIMQGTIFVMRR